MVYVCLPKTKKGDEKRENRTINEMKILNSKVNHKIVHHNRINVKTLSDTFRYVYKECKAVRERERVADKKKIN